MCLRPWWGKKQNWDSHPGLSVSRDIYLSHYHTLLQLALITSTVTTYPNTVIENSSFKAQTIEMLLEDVRKRWAGTTRAVCRRMCMLLLPLHQYIWSNGMKEILFSSSTMTFINPWCTQRSRVQNKPTSYIGRMVVLNKITLYFYPIGKLDEPGCQNACKPLSLAKLPWVNILWKYSIFFTFI